MLLNSLTHITTQNSISFPVVPRLHAKQPPPLLRNCHQLLRRPVAAVRGSRSLATYNKTGSGKGMSWFYEVEEEEVRDYEVDRFGVVNNAVYNNYGQHGTFKLLEKIGFDADVRLAVAELSMKYIAPLQIRDRYLQKLRIVDYSTTRLYIEFLIVKLPNHEPIWKATTTLVHINENQRPSRIPPSTISKYNKFLLTENNK